MRPLVTFTRAAHGAILEAASLLRRRVDPQPVEGAADDGKERLLAWQARKVLDYIDRHITRRVLVADLCPLVWRSEAHFSRSFRGAFGCSPTPLWSGVASNWLLSTCFRPLCL